MEKIRIQNLSFRYPLSEKKALKNINLIFERSQMTVICGKSGCGKSTLLRHMKKQLIPYGEKEGFVYIDGKMIEETGDRESASKVGFIRQDPDSQIVTDKVWHELAFGLENLGLPTKVIKRRVAEMANYFGIQNWFRNDIITLSGGQKQLLNLASVMVMQPEILILDEPTSQLDPIATSEFLNTVEKINKDLGVTVIISEHRLEELIPAADKVVIMDEGNILAADNPYNISKYLTDEKTGKKHPMFSGMPPVMRIFSSLRPKEKAPLTVRDGRMLLEKSILKKSEEDVYMNVETEKKQADKKIRCKNDDKKEIIKAKSLWFKYEKDGDYVLKGTDLYVNANEFFCLLGGNGTGKSTLLKSLCGIIKPQRGKINVKDDVKIAMVPQNPQAIFTEITAEEELYEGVKDLNILESEKIHKVEKMLNTMEISHLAKSNPYDLSGGEQQRLAIGKVLLTEPDLLLLDEPTKGIDPFFKRTLANIIRKLIDEGLTVLAVSHDIEFCAEYADRCAMCFDGEVISEDDAKRFFSGNSFYTTAANRLLRNFEPSVVTCQEAVLWLKEMI